MNILENIIVHKKEEVAARKEVYPVKLLEQSIYYSSPCVSLKQYLKRPELSGIIAEIKRKSPSRGLINAHISTERTSIGYMQAGASALSILTDQKFFGGTNDDLLTARKFNYCPILRKDFTIDEYQIIEAKSIGADAILLLANVLDKPTIQKFSTLAKSLGLEVLLEIRSEEEIEKLSSVIDLVGVNNRDLKNFDVNIDQSLKLIDKLPKEMLKIAESGIDSPEKLLTLKNVGYSGFLMGEIFMKESRPEIACAEFIAVLKSLRKKPQYVN